MLHKNKQYFDKIEDTAAHVKTEMEQGLKILESIDGKIVTFFGSHQISDKSRYYKHCYDLSFKLGKKGYSIITGGGPGIMFAANSGAYDAGAKSIGFRSSLLKGEKTTDSILTKHFAFRFLFIRRFVLSIKSDALIFYPGGYGTLNELFEYLVLMQTGIADKVPIICVGKSYWKGMFDWIEKTTLKHKLLTNSTKDLKLLYFVDDHDEILKILG
jgi:uncharacterized protein (TIGR00730 family)